MLNLLEAVAEIVMYVIDLVVEIRDYIKQRRRKRVRAS